MLYFFLTKKCGDRRTEDNTHIGESCSPEKKNQYEKVRRYTDEEQQDDFLTASGAEFMFYSCGGSFL